MNMIGIGHKRMSAQVILIGRHCTIRDAGVLILIAKSVNVKRALPAFIDEPRSVIVKLIGTGADPPVALLREVYE